MTGLKIWLEERGFESLAGLFARNDVDLDVLFELSDHDLKEIGLTLGQRRRLLKALRAEDAGAASRSEAAPRRAVATGDADDRAERRQLTVMIVDLSGSTALSARLDPEEMRRVISAFQDAVAGEIARYEGHVANFMGDGVLGYFGWPKAHEDEADRAVRAGLAITRSVGLLHAQGSDAPLAVRVGIATGLVVVGDLVGEGVAQEAAVVGETPNLAARLQGAAEPGQVVISEQTRRLVASTFAVEDLGARPLKGLERPVQLFAVTGESAASSRFETRTGFRMGPIIGRDQELALLQERWARARGGEGQGVLLTGEAGIGKSRLARALLDLLRNDPHVPIRYQCSPYHRDSALWPVIQQLTAAACLSSEDTLEAKLDKLEALLGFEASTAREVLPLIAALVGVDAPARCRLPELAPQVRRARTLAILNEQMLALAKRDPVLVVLEDAHWIDPTTLEFMELGLDQIGDARVMVLLTSRPDGEPPLAAHPHVTRLTLNRLSRSAVERITTRVAGARRLPPAILEEIAARADGVPLFVEELTKAVIELAKARDVLAPPTWSAASIPATLHDSLMARLDRVPEVKRVAQLAACIGREFDYRTLSTFADLPEPELVTALDRLATAELVFRRGQPPDATYTFKHALVRDAAASSLLLSERRRVHGAILRVLESAEPPRPPELVAQHAEAAGLHETAIDRWLAAGQAAAARYANREAVSHFEHALRLVLGQAEGAQRDRKELEVRLALAVPQIAACGYASLDVEQTCSRARTLCEHLGESEHLFFVLRGLWNCVFDRAALGQSLEIADRLLALASRTGDAEALALAYRALGTTRFNRGEFADALDAFQRSMNACRELGENAGTLHYGEAPFMISGVYRGWTLSIMGHLDEGLRAGWEALAAAHRSGHPLIIAFVSQLLCNILVLRRQPEECVEVATAGRRLAEEHLLVFWIAGLTIAGGWGLAHSGRIEEGIEQLRSGIADWKATGASLHLPTWYSYLADALLLAGAADDAETAIAEAIDTAKRNGDVPVLSDLYRLKALAYVRTGRPADAENYLLEARATAARQGAKLFELRAARDLASFWADQGQRNQADALLRPAYAAITEGLKIPDLVEAWELLQRLGTN